MKKNITWAELEEIQLEQAREKYYEAKQNFNKLCDESGVDLL